MRDPLFRMALLLGLLSAVGPFAIDMYLPALPQVASDLGTTEAGAALTLTSYFIVFGFAQMIYGPMADAVGRKKPLVIGVAIFLVATVAASLAPTIGWLIAARALQGLGAATLMAVPRAEMTVEEASDQWFIDHFNSAGSRCRGDYKSCMEAWLRQFEAGRLRWFLYDEVVADPRSVLVRCAEHLGVDPGYFRDLPEDRLNARYNEGAGVPIRPSLHAYLARLYRPQILALQDYLKRDLSAWLDANDRAMEAAPRRWLDRFFGR